MMPIQNLLNRIRWDEDFARGEFTLGYYDRIEDRIIRVRLRDIVFPPGDHFAFEVIDDEGALHSVPYHRVREVLKDGTFIWSRHP